MDPMRTFSLMALVDDLRVGLVASTPEVSWNLEFCQIRNPGTSKSVIEITIPMNFHSERPEWLRAHIAKVADKYGFRVHAPRLGKHGEEDLCLTGQFADILAAYI